MSRGTKGEEEGSSDETTNSILKRKELLKLWRFPRQNLPPLSKIQWTAKHTPQLLRTLAYHGLLYPCWRMQNPRTPEEEGVVVKGRIGRSFYEFITQPDCLKLLNKAFKPWGYFNIGSGRSMLPTLGANPSLTFNSNAYSDGRDICRGDVVSFLGPKFDDQQATLCKRVVAFKGERVWVFQKRDVAQQIVRVYLARVISR